MFKCCKLRCFGYKQKGFVSLILIVLMLVGAAVAGYLYLGKNLAQISLPTPKSLVTPTPINPDETANWEIYNITPDSASGYQSYQIKLPTSWKQLEHSSSFQNKETFQDGNNIYKLIIEEQKNLNSQTGKPYADLKELSGFPYEVPKLVVDGQEAVKPSPRAGSEYIYMALFFSKDSKLVYSITLETPSDGSKIKEGESLFDQILSTFKFIDQESGERVECTTPRPEVCTMECIANPPYLCGSNGKSYCSSCQACSNKNVEWYVTQETPCKLK